MAQITATVQVPITVNWSQNGEPLGAQSVTALAVVSRNVEDPEGWGAVGNWEAGQATAAVQGEGSESGSGGGGSSSSSSSSSSGGS